MQWKIKIFCQKQNKKSQKPKQDLLKSILDKMNDNSNKRRKVAVMRRGDVDERDILDQDYDEFIDTI